ncbi:phosphotransferase [Streptomyces sp. M41(2017)]|uniref:phosphotransferase family protein n=1 Tax=Streptomyces sp. M41(2017) TaxID=1955065 RepID=UPI0009C05B76|nr:phosphotransferase [Streptomyces sp. M41(2017)]
MTSGGRDRGADVRNIIAAHMPTCRIQSVVRLGEGMDNLAYEVDGELIVRLSKESDPARRADLVVREARLLAAVAEISPLPVPEPTFVDAEQGCLAYRKLPGTPLLDMPPHRRAAHAPSIAATLGELLTALHAAPLDLLAGLMDADHPPPAAWLLEAEHDYTTVAGHVPAPYRRPVETFLAAAPPDAAYVPVFSHNDLGIEHVLVDPGTWTVSGVLDWSDAAVVDPAYDFGLLHRDLGPAAVRAAISSYRADDNDLTALGERAVFYARCTVLEDLAHGITAGQSRYVDKSIAAMEWLFGGSQP